MISVNDLKTGLTLELDNGLWSVVEFLHVKKSAKQLLTDVKCSISTKKALITL